MSAQEYTVTYSNHFTVDGSEVADRIQKFIVDWNNDPPGILKLVSAVYLDGVKSGLQKAGYPIKDCKEIQKENIKDTAEAGEGER